MKKFTKPTKAENIKTAVIMRGTGHNHQEIADEIGVSRSTVANHLKQLKNEAEEHGVDKTLQRILLADSTIDGMIAQRVMNDLEWWMNHHRINSQWLIIRLWQLCHPDGEEDIEGLKSVVKAALPHFADDTGLDLEAWATEKNRCVKCGSTLAPSRQRSGDCCRIIVMK